tara:strand:- start:163 stop:579 length:417 start_codon:yes stop_codon:yes gene_type:complete
MNTVMLFLVAIPALEIFLMIKVGENIGALNTVAAIFLTAIVGIYFAKIEGLNTLRSGVSNLYKNKLPIFEMISGASIAFAAVLLIIPGFVTDFFGFLLLIPFTRKIIINLFFQEKKSSIKEKDNYIEGEIVDKDKDEL